MKLIGIEEHFLTSEISNAWKNAAEDDPTQNLHLGEIENRLDEVGSTRLSLMDESGVDVQVLSLTSSGIHNLGSASVNRAKQTNEFVTSIIKNNPGRFQGFAALPTPVPKEEAKELERSIKNLGLKGGMLCGRTIRIIDNNTVIVKPSSTN